MEKEEINKEYHIKDVSDLLYMIESTIDKISTHEIPIEIRDSYEGLKKGRSLDYHMLHKLILWITTNESYEIRIPRL